jgi:hypothetical protein
VATNRSKISKAEKVNPAPSADDNGDDPRAAVSSMHVTMEEQSEMARRRERVCLDQGLKLDLVQLARGGFIRFGANVGPRSIRWQNGMSGEVTASGIITADMTGSDFGWLQIIWTTSSSAFSSF